MIQIIDKKLQKLQTHTRTRAQNCHCEFCCGMHLTCKNTSITPDRNGLVKWPDKVSRSCQRHSMCWNWSNWKQTLPHFKLRMQMKMTMKIDVPVLGLAGSHGREMENWCRYADWRPNLYHQIKQVSSLVAVPSDLPLPPENCNEKEVRSYWEAWKSNIRTFT